MGVDPTAAHPAHHFKLLADALQIGCAFLSRRAGQSTEQDVDVGGGEGESDGVGAEEEG